MSKPSFLYVVDAGNIVMTTGYLTDKFETGKPVGGSEDKCLSPRQNNISYGTESFEFFGTLILLFGFPFENNIVQRGSLKALLWFARSSA